MFIIENTRSTSEAETRGEAVELAREQSSDRRGETIVTNSSGTVRLVYEGGRLTQFALQPADRKGR